MSSQYPPPPEPGDQGYPGMGSMPAQRPPAPASVAQPGSIALAVKLMYAGALLSLLGSVVTLAMRDSIREQVERAATGGNQNMTPAAIDAAVAIGVGVAIVSGVIGAVLWAFMAWANGRGKAWARILATVLFGLSVLSFVGSLFQRPPVVALVLSLVSLVLGAVIIFLLWKKESTAYYQAQSAPHF
jgi:hypothetical protein